MLHPSTVLWGDLLARRAGGAVTVETRRLRRARGAGVVAQGRRGDVFRAPGGEVGVPVRDPRRVGVSVRATHTTRVLLVGDEVVGRLPRGGDVPTRHREGGRARFARGPVPRRAPGSVRQWVVVIVGVAESVTNKVGVWSTGRRLRSQLVTVPTRRTRRGPVPLGRSRGWAEFPGWTPSPAPSRRCGFS